PPDHAQPRDCRRHGRPRGRDVRRPDRGTRARARSVAAAVASLHESLDQLSAETRRRYEPFVSDPRKRPAPRRLPARLPVLSTLSDREAGMREHDAGAGGSGTGAVGAMFVCEMKGVLLTELTE